jgi:hypothetical protein
MMTQEKALIQEWMGKMEFLETLSTNSMVCLLVLLGLWWVV